MNKLHIELKHCYWITSFDHEFGFSKWKTHLIYAKNWTMKTSFTNTFERFSEWNEPEERIHWNTPQVTIKFDSGNNFPWKNILAIQSLKEPTSFEKTSTLLARESLRKRYDTEMNKIEEAKKWLDKILYNLFSKKSYADVYQEFANAFNVDSEKVDEILEDLELELNWTSIGMSSWSRYYKDIFDKKILDEIKDENVQKWLTWYIKIFQELAKKSNFFRGTFNHTSAEELWNSLKKAWFFEVKHGVTLRESTLDPTKNREANTIEEYTKYLEDDEKVFFSTKEMKDEYQKLNKLFLKPGLYNLWSLVVDPSNSALIPELLNIEEFRKKVIKSVLQDNLSTYNDWLSIYKAVKITLAAIITEANADREEWNKVISEYQRKFDVPFKIKVWNHSDVMLKWSKPILIFEHTGKEVEKDLLWRILSTWERRALYILDIIFEIETRKKDNKETLIIIDDIADSFDYQNKHAIIEYLKEISQHEKFYVLILTHNFDFFRSLSSRLSINRNPANRNENHAWITMRNSYWIELEVAHDLDPFKILRQECYLDVRKFICSIPFVRNLVEYSKWNKNIAEYDTLTLCLHYKPIAPFIKASEVFDIFKEYIIKNQATTLSFDETAIVHDLIIWECNTIVDNNEIDDYRIFNKIILSIGIRLLAEKFLITELALNWTESIFQKKNKLESFMSYIRIYRMQTPYWLR